MISPAETKSLAVAGKLKSQIETNQAVLKLLPEVDRYIREMASDGCTCGQFDAARLPRETRQMLESHKVRHALADVLEELGYIAYCNSYGLICIAVPEKVTTNDT